MMMLSAKPVISQPQNEITNQRILLVEIHTCVLLISVDVEGSFDRVCTHVLSTYMVRSILETLHFQNI